MEYICFILTVMRIALLVLLSGWLLSACSVATKLQRSAEQTVLNNAALQNAHVGISIFEPASGKWWYNHQGDKYFVPASNTKLATCYAAMKFLGDSLVSARIAVDEKNRLQVFPTGDPTVLNPEFPYQPLLLAMRPYKRILWNIDQWKERRWGSGWSWNDYDEAYMAERSPFPIYGNVVNFYMVNDTLKAVPFLHPAEASPVIGYNKESGVAAVKTFQVERELDENRFFLRQTAAPFSGAVLPLRTSDSVISALLADTLNSEVIPSVLAFGHRESPHRRVVHSQPTDSLLKPMMHRSDNFFAEQALLMVSNELLGYMSDERVIDTLLKTVYADLPQKPRWVDGSGLSRYNLFTPQDLVTILQKMKAEFGMTRLREILPTGNEGTLKNYYKADSTAFYAKTGTLSGVVAISGFLTTKQGKELIFSVLVNNHNTPAAQVRRAVEAFLQNLRNRY